jgi:hypothetical protein
METQKSIIVAFHIGRGGRFNNGGHKTYLGEKDINEMLSLNDSGKNHTYYIDRDSKGRFCAPYYADLNMNHIISVKELGTGVGQLEWDTIYDTDICKFIEDCSEDEIELIAKDTAYKSYELREWLELNDVEFTY